MLSCSGNSARSLAACAAGTDGSYTPRMMSAGWRVGRSEELVCSRSHRKPRAGPQRPVDLDVLPSRCRVHAADEPSCVERRDLSELDPQHRRRSEPQAGSPGGPDERLGGAEEHATPPPDPP